MPIKFFYTTCPVEYDGFGTETVRVAGTTKNGQTVREVSIAAEHYDWQLHRYYSGGIYLNKDLQDFRRLVVAELIVEAKDECPCCGREKAYGDAIFCGAACNAQHEAKRCLCYKGSEMERKK